MTRTLLTIGYLALAAGCAAGCSHAEGSAQPPDRQQSQPRRISAPGTIEPISEEIDLGSEVPGKLEQVPVVDGSAVKRGQVVAVLSNADYAAAVASARATLEEREAVARRVVNGARNQERQEAKAAVEAADAVLANAVTVRDRRRRLLEQGAISPEEADRAEQAWRVAEAQRRASTERYALVNDEAREEDRAQALAAVALARAAVAQAEAVLAKTYVRSPIDGVVLRKRHHAGETIGNTPGDPIVTVGDVSRLRVRAEIDELDLQSVGAGQSVRVHVDAFGSREFKGTIASIGQALGKKKVHTEDPAERADAKVLEALIDLEETEGLRPRLRVDVFVDVRGSDGAE